jgi:uncharacterized membrane protein
MTQSSAAINKVPIPEEKRALLGEQTAWTLLANIVYIYRHHFVVVVAAALPVFPSQILSTFAQNNLSSENVALLLIALILQLISMVLLFLVPAAVTVIISDICVGNAPNLKRAYKRILAQGRWWHCLTTYLLVGIAIELGVILLIVPGLWFFMRALFVAQTVVLEDRRNRDAIRRSFALTKGQTWRLTGLLLVPLVLMLLSGTSYLFFAHYESAQAIGVILAVLTTPVVAMLNVLLYYDQRVRRESYDAQALAEDLMR